MATYSLPHFEALDPEDLDEYYDVNIDFNGTEIQIDLNFEETNIDVKRLDIAKHFIENIAEFDKKNKQYIEQDFADKEMDSVRTYVQHHLQEMDKDKLNGLVNFSDVTTTAEIQLVKALHLKRVGLYPTEKDHFAIFDYTIGREVTQYLVVIYTKENGDLDYVTMES